MRVIVTRPAAQAAAWTRRLAEHGIEAVSLPLIDIVPPADALPVQQAWRDLARRQLVVFVSPNAAEQFFAQAAAGQAWPPGVLAASVGPGTSETLRHHGVPATLIVEPAADAAQFDSESLWQQLQDRLPWATASVLIVRGDGGRDWLADTLRERGAAVDFVAAYRRVAARFEGATLVLLERALAEPTQHLWFFSSSEAVDHLAAARPRASWAASRAIATHPRIAERARRCGFGTVHETRPTLDSVVACIQSRAS